MPNGRSGGFLLKATELSELLADLDGRSVVGQARGPVTVDTLRVMLGDSKRDPIRVEEQDGEWYILHLQDWFTVDAQSPLFNPFRRLHAEWVSRKS